MVCTVAAPPESLMDFLLGNERWGQLAFILISLEQERVGAVVPRVGLNGQRGERLPTPQPPGGEEGVRNCGLCGMQGSQKWLLLAMNEMKLGPGELTVLPSPSAATRREVTPWASSGTRPGQSITVLQFCQKGSSHPRGAESAGFWESTCSFLGKKKKKDPNCSAYRSFLALWGLGEGLSSLGLFAEGSCGMGKLLASRKKRMGKLSRGCAPSSLGCSWLSFGLLLLMVQCWKDPKCTGVQPGARSIAASLLPGQRSRRERSD